MHRIVIWYNKLSSFHKIVINSFSIAIPFYVSPYLGVYLGDNLKIDQPLYTLLVGGIFIVWFTIIISFSKIFKLYQERIKAQTELEKETLYQAYTICDRILTHRLSFINEHRNDSNGYASILITSKREIQEIVDAAYYTFESTYGKAFNDDQERINFEVTFMAKSYSDGNITIPASANKDGRSPISMLLRKDNAKIYDNTITASMFRDENPTIKIIEDTSATNTNYRALYINQLDRIKSSIIFPVLSDSNELLGTLVVHCDYPNFFLNSKKKFWINLLEIFAKRIALEKVKMDLLHGMSKGDIAIKNDDACYF